MKVAPSILSADFGNLLAEIKKAEKSGADLLHLDVMDGHFVPNLTFGPVVLQSLSGKTRLPLDVHLMVNNPEKFIVFFAPLKPLYITFHLEAVKNADDLIRQIKEQGIKAGLSIKPATAVSSLFEYLEKIDLVLMMTVNPGFAGQAFMPEVLPKIKELRKEIESRKLNLDIEVDGGIKDNTANLVKEAGANILVAGSAVFGSSDMKAAIARLKE
ncbi:MAG: ribulose-phosphate 3-epimerase [Candidatus Ratteibacteria bacterium]|nr:ribulose-phosphate 3-epimerase [Candidatus Ratteibacteria bacterium]